MRHTTTPSGTAPARGRPDRSTRRARTAILLAGVSAAISLAAPGIAGAGVTAPRDVIAFPARDFISASGYNIDQPVTVEIQHPSGVVAGTVKDVTPKEDPATPGLGLVEVNHPVAPAGSASPRTSAPATLSASSTR